MIKKQEESEGGQVIGDLTVIGEVGEGGEVDHPILNPT